MKKILPLAVVSLAFAAVGFAADKPEFATSDKDKNGYVSREEAASVPGLAEMFAAADADSDGQLSRAEFDAAVAKLEA